MTNIWKHIVRKTDRWRQEKRKTYEDNINRDKKTDGLTNTQMEKERKLQTSRDNRQTENGKHLETNRKTDR